jgi:hypothetical protein
MQLKFDVGGHVWFADKNARIIHHDIPVEVKARV